jgi:hypothetical protein
VATATFWRSFRHDGKLAQADEGGVGGARPSFFTIFAIMYKVAVDAPAERAAALSLFLFDTYLYSVEKQPAKTDNSNQLAGSLVHRTPDQEA